MSAELTAVSSLGAELNRGEPPENQGRGLERSISGPFQTYTPRRRQLFS